MQKKLFTLTEMLVAIAVLGLTMNAIIIFFFDGMKICNEAFRDADFIRTTFLLRTEWRKFICENKVSIVGSDENNKKQEVEKIEFAKFADGKLTLSVNDKIREFRLPKECSAKFYIENTKEGSFAILELNYGKAKRRILASL